jgi:hypothetical protein
VNRMAVVGVVGALIVAGLVVWLTSRTKSRMAAFGDSIAKQAAADLEDVDPELLESPDGGGADGEAVDDMPPYFHKKVAHLKAMTRIMKLHIGDCEKLGEEMESYMNEHEEEMQALDRAEAKARLEMSPAERTRFEKKAMARIKPLLFDMVKMAALVAFKCPHQAQSIERAKARVEH